jgi:hypothetical protein
MVYNHKRVLYRTNASAGSGEHCNAFICEEVAARGRVEVETLCYMPQGRGFETR